ncbi:hypothetical protein BCR42DRAFT_418402, partial [Absidia repens]
MLKWAGMDCSLVESTLLDKVIMVLRWLNYFLLGDVLYTYYDLNNLLVWLNMTYIATIEIAGTRIDVSLVI